MPDSQPILLLTRPKPGADRFLALLDGPGDLKVVRSPLIGITFNAALPDLSGMKGLIFTSSFGVQAYAKAGGRRDLPAYVVGERTAQSARDIGFVVGGVGVNADGLVRQLQELQIVTPMMHIRGTHSRGDVAMRLTQSGLTTIESIMYDQPELPLTSQACDALSGEIPVIAPIFSPRTAALLAKNRIQAPLLVAAMSEAVVKPLLSLHITELRIAARPESGEMVRLVRELATLGRAKTIGSGP